ncbi:DUF1642 domain-containing protein [Enterococcus faecalis]|uniref:DUF1642 domain-containing protein n=1 Tax=Enterococcus gallinarum TaxID=1353 RepID=UPI00107360B1|nr:DUF1642 domain-containing protein [Enterococcus gallinarum]MBF0820960.1 DUF1642 domain-containing protein [Enterococcus faecalis]MBF0724985.1 DUF1642 domain-containing protein [Enterococcus gallinarum]MBF0796253.1 DUF1642 domain-containing protein [Enterococcus gallinarum]MBX8979496.1 DUF1642 domain-containing protein [Enterococcus gallinarum]NYS81086.1 DUF1642 domain-containing protein [Enterococcus gallinarum]
MNKQELINSVKAWGAWCTDHNTGEKDRYVKINKVREFVEQLDEQPKITVPQFLDKYIQENKGECASDVFSEEWLHDSADELDDEVDKWLYDNDGKENDRRYLIAIQAFVTGEYEVEKEPLYQIELPGTSWGAYLTKADNGDLVIFQNTTSGSTFTESEIKAIDERYWAFAVQVEEPK